MTKQSVLCSVLSPWASHLLQNMHMFYFMNLFLIRAVLYFWLPWSQPINFNTTCEVTAGFWLVAQK